MNTYLNPDAIQDRSIEPIKLNSAIIEVTYAELKALRDNVQLIPGQQYRITDYVTSTTQSDTTSANHQFDIIVTADSESTLNEVARAIQHDSDTYFANSDLSAWKIWYCLDNDTERFAWADTENGKGVIYRMIDEAGNDCPYDFKNIKFKHPKDTAAYPDYYYTFTVLVSDVVSDHSLNNSYCYNNVINEYYLTTEEKCGNSLNKNVFINTTPTSSCNDNSFGNYCHSNSFGNNCCYNSFGENCYYNSFEYECSSNSFGNYCYYNSFEYNCCYNSFGNVCNYNSFGNGCNYNSFGNNCNDNSFGNYCCSNSFVENCYYNSFGDSCNYNSFVENCYYNSFGDSCYSNSFGNECNNNTFEYNCYYNSFGNYCHSNSFGNECYSNSFENCCYSNSFVENCYSNSFGNTCNNNSFGNECNSNSFGNTCDGNSFGNDCYNNSFGNDCSSNSFENACYNNSFENECDSNSFGNTCYDNSFGDGCCYNSFGNNYCYNSFENGCYNNSFGNKCNYNSFGNNCNRNSFVNECNGNSFGNNCYSNSFGNNCNYNSFGNECSKNSFRVGSSNTSNLRDHCNSNKFCDGCNSVILWNSTKASSTSCLQSVNVNLIWYTGSSPSSYYTAEIGILRSLRPINVYYNGYTTLAVDYGEKWRHITSSTTLTKDDRHVICDNTSAITITLPTGWNGAEYYIHKRCSKSITNTIKTTGNQYISYGGESSSTEQRATSSASQSLGTSKLIWDPSVSEWIRIYMG